MTTEGRWFLLGMVILAVGLLSYILWQEKKNKKNENENKNENDMNL
ncbi:cbb3-type cytochrome oxidase subunit 3 [Paenibacillus baekrokdamisoli]|nr:hypothetical protein [Paenibacillus baekrokdamisoli]MBB3068906.1 cbb3-type cytochrome oxidase subunit 3 [Paenibacillus baekrokdamisoli]